MSKYDVVMGIEVHIELKTKAKCFSSTPNTFAEVPNTKVSAIDAGFPGTLPTVNKAVVVSALKLCKALKMEIDNILRFDRKNYFYADLPKGYQITQFFHPIGKGGSLDLIVQGKAWTVAFDRLHIEEDTAKQIHHSEGTYLDYNRAGIPLLELVTKPEFKDNSEVIAYITSLRQILLCLDISDAKMNEGSMRCDLNISLKPTGSKILGTKVEIKNLNSLNNISLAIDYEIKRQTELLDRGKPFISETRRFDEKTNTTVLMRDKTSVLDYKYFRDPNILPIKLEDDWMKEIINSIPMLPWEISNKYEKEYHLTPIEINILLERPPLRILFEKVLAITNSPKATINYLLGPVLSYLNTKHITDWKVTKLKPNFLAELIILIINNEINSSQAKIILEKIFDSDEESPQALVKIFGFKFITDESIIKEHIKTIFAKYPKNIENYNDNPSKVNRMFMGELMKIMKGQVNPVQAQKLLNELVQETIKK